MEEWTPPEWTHQTQHPPWPPARAAARLRAAPRQRRRGPAGVMDRFRAVVAPASRLAIVHFHNPGGEHPEASAIAAEALRSFNRTLCPGRWRTRGIVSYFGDLELVAPGLVPLTDWRSEPGEAIRLDVTRHNVPARRRPQALSNLSRFSFWTESMHFTRPSRPKYDDRD
ncbi:SAM-dependent methyltransferase [Nonomuraea gerenzanensis]|nr:SAM-dependent methyltransferase [Nonomuraea gerenzanensis]